MGCAETAGDPGNESLASSRTAQLSKTDLPPHYTLSVTIDNRNIAKLPKTLLNCPEEFPFVINRSSKGESDPEQKVEDYTETVICAEKNFKMNDTMKHAATTKVSMSGLAGPGCYVFKGSSTIYLRSVGKEARDYQVGNNSARIIVKIHGEKGKPAARGGRYEVDILSGGSEGTSGWIEAKAEELEALEDVYCENR